MAWVLLLVAGLLEVGWSIGMLLLVAVVGLKVTSGH